MERVISPEERIRKAEDLYYRRKIQSMGRQTARVSVDDKRSYHSLKKFFKQSVTCIIIYLLWYGFQNSSYIFSDNINKNVKQLLEYDLDLSSVYSKLNLENLQDLQDRKIEDIQNALTLETIAPIEDTLSITEEANKTEETIKMEETSSISQMQEDAEYIKLNYSIVKPLSGTITSRFGLREASSIVTKYHTGIDIAVNEGTVFIAAMSGKVELVSTVGDYRKSL